MSRSGVTKWKVFGISMVISLALATVFILLRLDLSVLDQIPPVILYRVLCDAFTVPGLLMLMFALLMSVSNEGALDGVGYVAAYALKMLIPGAALKTETYKEYLERRRANRVKNYVTLYLTALICLIVAAVFLVLFYTVFER